MEKMRETHVVVNVVLKLSKMTFEKEENPFGNSFKTKNFYFNPQTYLRAIFNHYAYVPLTSVNFHLKKKLLISLNSIIFNSYLSQFHSRSVILQLKQGGPCTSVMQQQSSSAT